VLKSDGTKWIDITNEIKTKPINKPWSPSNNS
jgi:hypothetical protein